MENLTPVFISYDKRDRYFVNLLRALLGYENVESWLDREKIAAGDKYQDRIQEGLRSARSLIVIVSEHSLQSSWVRAELTTFCMLGTDALIIPITLDATTPAQLDQRLEAYQAISMREDMLHGFESLFACYGRGFLTGQGQRRSDINRRATPDRRRNILRRLRIGLWQHYAHTTGLGKFDTIEVNLVSSAKIASALQLEIAKYEIYDENKRQIDSKWALDQALKALETDEGASKAIYVIERLATYLCEHYEVRNRDRRDKLDRRTAKARAV